MGLATWRSSGSSSFESSSALKSTACTLEGKMTGGPERKVAGRSLSDTTVIPPRLGMTSLTLEHSFRDGNLI